MITGEQVTQARELLRWSIVDLAHWSGVPRSAILMFEVETQRLEEDEVDKIKTAIERVGIEFTNGAHPGVRLKAGGLRDQATIRGPKGTAAVC
jgi:hypothetical protein